MATATHDYPELALQTRAALTPRPITQAALRRPSLARPSCCDDPECDEATAWDEYLTLALAEHSALAFDLAMARWQIAKRECLIRQTDAGLRTWASVGEFLARLKD
jgi:hypothetical protein